MRVYLRALPFVAVLAVGTSVILGSSAPARGEEALFYNSGAPAGEWSSGRGHYAGFRRGQANYQVPASGPGTIAGYWYYYPQPVYPVPTSSPTPVTGYWHHSPQPVYRVTSAGLGTIAGYWYYYPVWRR